MPQNRASGYLQNLVEYFVFQRHSPGPSNSSLTRNSPSWGTTPTEHGKEWDRMLALELSFPETWTGRSAILCWIARHKIFKTRDIRHWDLRSHCLQMQQRAPVLSDKTLTTWQRYWGRKWQRVKISCHFQLYDVLIEPRIFWTISDNLIFQEPTYFSGDASDIKAMVVWLSLGGP